MAEQDTDIDWTLTTWTGSRRDQLRQWRKLSLRQRFQAVEEMADLGQHFQHQRKQGKFSILGNAPSAGNKDRISVPRDEAREPGTAYSKEPQVHELTLSGCTPEPLMNYLKALGVLRLVGEQADPNAHGFWRNGEFVLRSALGKDELTEFFITAYKPSPFFSPWNGDGGFLSETGTSYQTIEAIKAFGSAQLAGLRDAIDTFRGSDSLQQLGQLRYQAKQLQEEFNKKYGTKADKWKKKAADEEKSRFSLLEKRIKRIKQILILNLRSESPEDSIPWLDVCLAITQETISMSPLLGSGGVDGRMEFSANYLSNVLAILQSHDSKEWFKSSLFGEGAAPRSQASIGQFAPGAIGGPNGTQGMEGDSLINRWDYVLMLEGTVLLGGSVCRKLGVSQAARAAFPFTVTSLAAGESTLAQKEVRESRGEIWLPLWHQPAGVSEIQYIFTEGRSELRGRQSTTSTDFARSVADLGVDRGILSFSRQGFLKRNGLAFIATPLGRFDVHGQEKVRLLFEIDVWLDHFRYACKIGQKGEAPARLATSLRHIDEAIFAYCRYGGPVQFQKILIALGRAERELMRDGQWAVKNAVRPLFGLSSDWVAAANDGSVEFELALSLSEIRGIGDIGSLRTNLEPVRLSRRKDGLLYGDWADKDRSVVWNAAALSSNMANLLSRRLLDARRLNSDHLPLWSTRTASLEAISMFAAGLTDDTGLEDLLWGLMLVGGREADELTLTSKLRRWPDAPPLSRLYAFLKPLFLPSSVLHENGHWRYARSAGEGIAIRPEPCVLQLLNAGRISDAVNIAAQRLRSSGLNPLLIGRNEGWGNDGNRLAAALLFPISSRSLDQLFNRITRTETTANEIEGETA